MSILSQIRTPYGTILKSGEMPHPSVANSFHPDGPAVRNARHQIGQIQQPASGRVVGLNIRSMACRTLRTHLGATPGLHPVPQDQGSMRIVDLGCTIVALSELHGSIGSPAAPGCGAAWRISAFGSGFQQSPLDTGFLAQPASYAVFTHTVSSFLSSVRHPLDIISVPVYICNGD